jgi:exodeoxyribonuclease-3
MSSPAHLLSWNVNGLRAVLKKGFDDFLAAEAPDLLCLQETKLSSDLIDGFAFAGYPHVYWNCAEKKGYSGTAILSQVKPLNIHYGIGIQKHDTEGRVITAEFNDYYLVTVYTPNAQNHDANRRPRRLDYRTLEWDVDFLNYLKELEQSKPVVFCGDLNVAHTEIDLANPKTNRKNAGFTDEERARFDAYPRSLDSLIVFATCTRKRPNVTVGGRTERGRGNAMSVGASTISAFPNN